MAFGGLDSGKQQRTAHFSQPDEQSRIFLRWEREHFLMDVLSSAVGGLCDPCGSRLIGLWLSWGCVLAEVLVDGVIFFIFFASSRCSASSSSPEMNRTSLIRHSESNYTYLRPHRASYLFLIKSLESSTSPLPHQQKRGERGGGTWWWQSLIW